MDCHGPIFFVQGLILLIAFSSDARQFFITNTNFHTMNLMDIFQSQLSDEALGQISEHIGAEKEQTATAANGIFASLLGGLANNASSEEGMSGIMGMLDRDNDGSVLDDIAGMIGGVMGGGQQADNNMGILGSILGDRQEAAVQQVSQSSGLNIGQVMKLLPILAPIVMGVLGRAKNQGNLGLGDLAGILMGSAQNAQQGGFGDLIGSVLGGVMGGNNQQEQAPQQGGGMDDMLGSVLGNIFGKK